MVEQSRKMANTLFGKGFYPPPPPPHSFTGLSS